MRVLITGHHGFLGSLLTDRIESEGHQVIGISRLDQDLSKECILPDDIDLVYHCAAKIGDRVSPALFQDNINISYNVFNACHKALVPVIYLSSCEIYGNGLSRFEADPYNPTNMYAVSKIASEQLLKQFGFLGLDYKIIRLFNPMGPGQNNPQFVLRQWYNQAMAGKPLVIYASKEDNIPDGRDWVWQDDTIEGLWQARNWPNRITVHLSSGIMTSNMEMTYMFAGAIGKSVEVILQPYSYGHSGIKYQSGSPHLANSLGWKATVPVEEAIRRTVKAWQST